MSEKVVKEYIEFVRMPYKTEVWSVLTKRRGDWLGRILWYGQWRQYVFETEEGCVFSKGCLDDIADFVAKLMRDRKVKA